AFRVRPAATQKLWPAAWEIASSPIGAPSGSNLRVTFIEGIWSEDAQGKPLPTGRNIVIGSMVKKKVSTDRGLMMVGGLTTGAPPGVDRAYSKPTTTSQRSLRPGGPGV